MTIALLELNDINLRLFTMPRQSRPTAGDQHQQVQPQLIAQSPGYALVTPSHITLGEEAQRQSRIHPHEVYNQFWKKLSLEPVTSKNTYVRHCADLAYSHLNALQTQGNLANPPITDWVIALSSHFTHDQLALLLGIAGECEFDTRGLVDLAVLSVAPFAPTGRLHFLDIQLHQSVITTIRVSDQITREHVEVMPTIGLMSFYDHWAKMITDRFIQDTRFDPLHNATTEQRLYDQLPVWIEQCQKSRDLTLTLDNHSIKIASADWSKQVSSLYQSLDHVLKSLSEPNDIIILSDRWHQIPGSRQTWPQAQILPPQAVAQSFYQYQDKICRSTKGIAFITTLPASNVENRRALQAGRSKPPAAAAKSNRTRPVASHIVWRSQAFPLSQKLFLQLDKNSPLSLTRQPSSICVIEREHQHLYLKQFSEIKGCQLLRNGDRLTSDTSLFSGDLIQIRPTDSTEGTGGSVTFSFIQVMQQLDSHALLSGSQQTGSQQTGSQKAETHVDAHRRTTHPR